MFGLVAFAKVKLHPPSFIMRNAIHRAMTGLIFVPAVGELGGGNLSKLACGYEVPTNLYYGCSLMKANLATFYLTCDHFWEVENL